MKQEITEQKCKLDAETNTETENRETNTETRLTKYKGEHTQTRLRQTGHEKEPNKRN